MTTPDSNLKLNNPAQGSTTSNVTPKLDAVNETPIEKKKPTSLFTGLKREDIVDNQKLLDAFDEADNITKNGILDKDEFNAYSHKKQDYFNNNWVGLNRKEIEESFLSDYVKTNLYKTFDKFDTDKDRTISQQEYQSAFGKGEVNWIDTTYISQLGGQLKLNSHNDVQDFSAELLNMAKKADTNSDGILTAYEWQVFTLSKKLYAPEISKENATMLEGLNGGKISKNINNILKETNDGVYTAKKGETIESIAKKFGISRIDLCLNNNINVTTNTLEEGAQLKVTGIRYYGDNNNKLEEDDNAIFSIINANTKEEKLKKLSGFYKKNPEGKNSKVLLFEGMTREQAEKIGGDTLSKFNDICKGTDVVTHELYQLYLGQSSTIDKNKIMLITKDILGDDIGADDLKLIFKTIVPNLQDTVIDKNSTTAKGNKKAVLEVTMKYAKELTANNAIEYSGNFYSEIKDLIVKDKTSENGAYNYHLQRLKSGKFSDFEKNKLGLQGELTDEQAAKYAEIAAKAEFIVPVLESLERAVNENSDGKNDEKIMLFISGLGKEFFEEPSVSAIVKAYGLENIVDKMKAKIVANHFATTDKESFEELDPVAAGVYVNAIAKNADADAYQVFVENHADDVEFIQDVTNIVINNLPDGEQKTALQNAISKAVENISNGTVSSTNSGSKPSNTTNSTNGYSQGRTQTPTVNNTNYYATSPIMSDAQRITELKEAAAIYNNQINAPSAVHPTQTFKTELEKFMDEMHTKGAVMKAKFENMPLGQALSMVCDNINKIPEQLRGPFIEKFTQMMIIKANSHKDLMCKAYITGSENLRQFMNKNNIITERMIYDFFDKNESEIKFASKTLQVNYYKHKTEEQIKS